VIAALAHPLSMKTRFRASAASRPLCGLLALVAAGAAAQGMGSDLGIGYGPGGFLDSGSGRGGGGASSSGSGGRAFYMVPTFSSTATLTNNVNLSATDKQSDLILGISPGIQIGGQTGRIRGFLDYSLTGSFYASDQSTTFRNSLNASVNAEAVPNWLFIDASARISQQGILPFGTQSIDPSLNNSNSTQVTTVNVAPYVQGQIAGQVNYQGRAFYTYTDSGTSQASNSATWGAALGFDSTTRWSQLSWGLDFTYREATFSDSRTEFDQLNIVSLNYAVTPELRVSVRGNSETTNLFSFESETTTGWGGGLRWAPSPRTNLFIEYDQRAFGNSHLYSFDYRTPRTVWAISNRQGLSNGQFNSGRGNASSPFDLLFAQFATVEPDPVARAQLVNNFLLANGIDPNASLNTGYLPSQVVLERRREASVAWLGMRSTMIFNVFQTQTQALQPELLNPDAELSGGNVITWLGGGANWSHRLTPTATLSLSGSGRRTSESIGVQETTVWSGVAMWTSQVALRTNVSLSARHTVQSGTSSYNESALRATLNMTF
jgi:uncharacterized protein (PEP-CTERM system associated)